MSLTTFNLHYLSAEMMILLQNIDEKTFDPKNAQVLNSSAPEIVFLPGSTQTPLAVL